MNMILARNWWALALRGAAAIVFGAIALLLPGFMLVWLLLLFGAYALVDGVFAIVAGLRAAQRHERWWPFALEGLADIAIGVITFAAPGATAFVLLCLVSAWAILTGVLRISAAIRLRREISGEWLLALNGVLSVLLGIFLVAWPTAGLVSLVWLLGAFAIVFGITLVGLALRVRGHAGRMRTSGAKPGGAR
ncbi:MAG TPA: HdeD family acid-resistance protein [Candidatus Methylomirabilis sp.]|nr:HdeD family acid-resistance protein [Candidatus Methylomirabilis sp.]